jgi:hypothetical protein
MTRTSVSSDTSADGVPSICAASTATFCSAALPSPASSSRLAAAVRAASSRRAAAAAASTRTPSARAFSPLM